MDGNEAKEGSEAEEEEQLQSIEDQIPRVLSLVFNSNTNLLLSVFL